MRINVSTTPPSTEELMTILKAEFSSAYSYSMLVWQQKTILVGKTPIIGAQISTRGNEIMVQSTAPTLTSAYALSFLSFTLIGNLLGALVGLFGSSPKMSVDLEKDIAFFLKKKYG